MNTALVGRHRRRGQWKVFVDFVEVGLTFHEREQFARKEINLLFLQSKQEQYQQLGPGFINGLSIIDVLMFNSTELISTEFLPNYSLI
jgi:hypothetical protein